MWLTPTTVAALLGFISWTRLGPRSIGWISRWPLACLAGIGTGLAVKGVVGPQILGQLTTESLTVSDPLTSVNNVIIVVATVTTLCYFTFSNRHTSVLGALRRWAAFS